MNISSFPQPIVDRRDVMPALTSAPRVVAIGGGTGLPNLLRGLRPLLYGDRASTPRDQLVAVVTTTDDGGSSGRLRKELGVIPPGDIRNCLAALAEHRGLLADLFQYRFDSGGGLNGHALGNLVLAALADVTNDFARAVELAARAVGARGTVLPVTAEAVSLVAALEDGSLVRGETAIRNAGTKIVRLSLSPEDPKCLSAVIDAVAGADVIVLGPGSLYTSLLPPLLVPELAEAVSAARATRVFVMNLMTEPGETDGFGAPEHLRAIAAHVGRQLFDVALYSTATLSPQTVAAYASRGAGPVIVSPGDLETLSAMGARAIGLPLASEMPPGTIRHHPGRLGAAITAVARGKLGAWRPPTRSARPERRRSRA
ncbi:MAG: YvcK family protein [Acidobacteria bacterium]|nr:YvcK family protein [Acidobacteriota bacterium]